MLRCLYFFICIVIQQQTLHANSLVNLEMQQGPENAKLKFTLDSQVPRKVFFLTNPDRVVIDLSINRSLVNFKNIIINY